MKVKLEGPFNSWGRYTGGLSAAGEGKIYFFEVGNGNYATSAEVFYIWDICQLEMVVQRGHLTAGEGKMKEAIRQL